MVGCRPCSRDTGEEVHPAWATLQASGNWQAQLKPLKINPEALGGLPFGLQTMLCEPIWEGLPEGGLPSTLFISASGNLSSQSLPRILRRSEKRDMRRVAREGESMPL